MKTTSLRATFLSAMAASMGLVACMDQPSATGPSDLSATGLLIARPSEEPLAGNMGTPAAAAFPAEEAKAEAEGWESKAEADIAPAQPATITAPASPSPEETKEPLPSQPMDSKAPPTIGVLPEKQDPIQVIGGEVLPIEAAPVLQNPDPMVSPVLATPTPIESPSVSIPKPAPTNPDTGRASSKPVEKSVERTPAPAAGATSPGAAAAAPSPTTSPAPLPSTPPSKSPCKKGVSC